MSGNGRSDADKLAALDDFMIDQILNASDDEILSEAEEGDAEAGRAAFERARLSAGKRKMALARQGAARASSGSAAVPIDKARARQRLAALVAGSGESGARLTLAARGAKGDIDADEEGILEDLEDLMGPSGDGRQ